MTKTLAAARACTLLFGACSSMKPVEELEASNSTGSGNNSESGDTPEALSL